MKQQLTGIVISNKMQKTAVVKVSRLKKHPKYFKRYLVSKHYHAHDEQKTCKVGDTVVIESCRPISAQKHWKIVKVVNSKSSNLESLGEK